VTTPPRRLYAVVAACALVVYAGALWNRFAGDDLYIVVLDPLVHHASGLWRAFGSSYWAGNLNTTVYRPLAVATFALDWLIDGAVWFHLVNLLWHAAAAVMVAVLARRWAGDSAGWIAGLLFAVHPVHVEAVANIVGRNELMAALFTLLAVYAALERDSVWWTAAAMAAGILSKENAAVAPALIVWAWVVRLRPAPPRRRLARYLVSWVLVAAAYAALRWVVFRAYGAGIVAVAPVFIGQSPSTIRLTAVAALADVARLLLFPLHLQADYSPQERTAVTGLVDVRLLLGVLAVAVWVALLVVALRRGRRVAAFGLGWVALAYAPVANLLFPIGVLLAERTLYLPSAGLAIAVGGALARLDGRRLALVATALGLLGGMRTALRVPVWRDTLTMTVALADDAPRSYKTYDYVGWQFLWAHQPRSALEAFRRAGELFERDHRVYLAAADAAFTLHQPALADSMLARADHICPDCLVSYHNQAGAARLRGDSASADSLLQHADRLRRR
jgi:protein O-mannosyl-transferase